VGATTPDWSALPVPVDDGAARHLAGLRLPSVPLPATDGSMVDLSALPGRVVVYAYPRTAHPEGGSPNGWDGIPGARGCTPQSCAFRDHFTELQALGVSRLFGLSTQTTAYQQEAASRLHLPFPVFETSGMKLLRRLTLVMDSGVVRQVFYPVFPPDRNAADVAAWLARTGRA
jgi:peroxiredoxin